MSASQAQLDQLDAHEFGQWQRFYADRTRPCPFFIDAPDENLVEWASQGLLAGGRALDIGCGHGRNCVFLARQGFAVQAVDLSASALAWARERIADTGVAVDLHAGSVFDLAIEPNRFDLVYDAGCFHHIAPHRRRDYVRLVAAALKPGGFFGLVCFKPEGGSGLTDAQVYERGTLAGGLGYDEQQLRTIWSPDFEIDELRTMHDLPRDADRFGRDFLWVMRARRR